MSRRDPRLTLAQIREAAERALLLCASQSLEELLVDWKATAALERCIEIAHRDHATRVPPSIVTLSALKSRRPFRAA